jgi:cell surface protein SprA
MQRIINPEQRVLRDDLQITDRLRQSDQLGARTSLVPSTNMRIDLNWELGWTTGENTTYGLDGSGLQQVSTRTGVNSASVWAFGASYADFFRRQMDTYERDAARVGPNDPIVDADGDGRVVLTRNPVAEDFGRAFMRSLGTLDGRGFLPIPLPRWSVNYTGLNQMDLVRRFAHSVTLVHGYAATYNMDYSSSTLAGQEQMQSLHNRRIIFTTPDLEADRIRLNEQFNPLIGLNITWRGDLQTDISWIRSNSYGLSAGSATISASNTNEISLNASYSKRGISLPFMSGRALNNTLRLSLVLSRSESVESMHRLQADLVKTLSNEELDDPQINAVTRLSAQPRVSYVFSNRVTADFYIQYEHLDSQGSQIPTTTNVSGGFNVRVSIAN